MLCCLWNIKPINHIFTFYSKIVLWQCNISKGRNRKRRMFPGFLKKWEPQILARLGNACLHLHFPNSYWIKQNFFSEWSQVNRIWFLECSKVELLYLHGQTLSYSYLIHHCYCFLSLISQNLVWWLAQRRDSINGYFICSICQLEYRILGFRLKFQAWTSLSEIVKWENGTSGINLLSLSQGSSQAPGWFYCSLVEIIDSHWGIVTGTTFLVQTVILIK